MSHPYIQRSLSYRFLMLPFRKQIAVARSLNVMTDEDLALSDADLFREIFKRARDAGLLQNFGEEIDRRYDNGEPSDGEEGCKWEAQNR